MTNRTKKAGRAAKKFLRHPLTMTFAAAALGFVVNDATEYSLFDFPNGMNPVCSLDPYCRKLSDGEITIARSVFGDNIDLTHVKIFTRPTWPAGFFIPDNAIAFVAKYDNIHSRMGSVLSKDMSGTDALRKGRPVSSIFVHEMTHIWQHQHYGSEETGQKRAREYKQAEARLGDKFKSSALYNVSLFDYPSFDQFGVEQQAVIVADYYGMRNFILEQYNKPDYVPYWENTQILCIQTQRYKELLDDVVNPEMFTDFPEKFSCKL